MTTAESVLRFAEDHSAMKPLILLAALSILWQKPQNPEAAKLLSYYRSAGFDRIALRETALQLFILSGFQTSLEAFFQIREVYGETIAPDLEELGEPDARLWTSRGLDLQEKVYAAATPKLRENLKNISPELGEWTVSIGYGLVMCRPGLPAHHRELLEIAVLAVQGFPRQLHSHLRGALNLGSSREEVETILMLCDLFMDENYRRSAWFMWGHVR